MNIDDLKTFVVVCEAGSLSAAAGRLGVPVSTVSRRLSKLEDAIGQSLVERTGRGVRLDERANTFLGVVRTLLRELDAGIERFRVDAALPISRLRVAAPLETALSLLPEALLRTRREAPELTFEVIAERRRVAVFEENYDLAIRLGQRLPDDLIAQPLGAVSLHLVAAPAYLAERGVPQRPGDLAGHDAIVVAGGAPAALNFSGPDGQREPGVLRGPLVVSTFTEAARLVGLGAGLALLPSYTMNTMSTAAALTTILAEWTLPTVPLTALYPRRNRGALAISLLCEHIRAVLGEVQAR